jgi:hypothetical protein
MNKQIEQTIYELKCQRQDIDRAIQLLEDAAAAMGKLGAAFKQASVTVPELGKKLSKTKSPEPAAKRKDTRKAPQTPDEAKVSVDKLLTDPETFAAAVKKVMHESAKPLSVTEIFQAVQTRWPGVIGEKDASNVAANVAYWAANGKLEKLGMGSLVTFKIIDADFFSPKD